MSADPEKFRSGARRVENRWVQNMLGDTLGGVCLVGSLLPNVRGVDQDDLPPQDMAILFRALHRYPTFWRRPLGSQHVNFLTAWNDVPWRRKRTVVRALKRAAKIAEREWTPPKPRQTPVHVPTELVETKELVSV